MVLPLLGSDDLASQPSAEFNHFNLDVEARSAAGQERPLVTCRGRLLVRETQHQARRSRQGRRNKWATWAA